MKKILIIITLFLTFSMHSQSHIDWIIKPVDIDIDRILPNRYKTSDLYVVKKNKYYGVINTKGKLVLPIKYERVSLWSGDNFFDAIIDKKQIVFDRKGNTYKWDDAMKKNESVRKKTKINQLKANIAKLNNKEAFSIYAEKNSMIIKGVNGKAIDTIRNFRNSYMQNKDIYSVNNDFYILSKNKKYTKKEVGSIRYANDKFIVLDRGWKKQGLYDYDLNELLPKIYKRIQFSKYNDIIVVENTETKIVQIMDYDLNVLMEGKYGYIYFYKDKALFSEGEKIYLLDFITNTTQILPYRKFAHIKKSNQIITISDSLKGIYDVVNSKEILAASHKYSKVKGDFIIGYENKKQKIHTFHIYNNKGKKLLTIDGRGYSLIGKYLIIQNKFSTIIDQNGKIIEEGENIIKVTSDGFINVKQNSNSYYTPFVNYLNDNSPKLHFDGVHKSFSVKSKDNVFLIVNKNNKYGVIKKDGTVVIDFIFDEIISDDLLPTTNLTVKYKNKLGLISLPTAFSY